MLLVKMSVPKFVLKFLKLFLISQKNQEKGTERENIQY